MGCSHRLRTNEVFNRQIEISGGLPGIVARCLQVGSNTSYGISVASCVVAGAAIQQITTFAAYQQIVVSLAFQIVVTSAAMQFIIAAAARKEIRLVIAKKLVFAV